MLDGSTISGNVDCDAEALSTATAADPNVLVAAGDDNSEQNGDNNDDGDSGDTGDGGDTGDSSDASDSGESGGD